jgi:MFS transporter, DHA1 family, inner membrane transport protein
MYCVLLVSYMLMAADRYLFPVLATDVRREFGFTLADTGLLSTIFTLGLGLGGLPTSYLLARFSRKIVILSGIVIFSAATALTSVSAGFWRMLLCLAATGLGMSMLATSMFALASSYFHNHRAAAIGSVNFCYGIGGFLGPILAGSLLVTYGSWQAPMVAFGLFGLVMVMAIAFIVRPWFTDGTAQMPAAVAKSSSSTLVNINTALLTAMGAIQGLVMYGFLGMYPTFLREDLHYSPSAAGLVMSFFGLGALASIAGGWIGDRFSPRVVLSGAFLAIGVLGYLLFRQSGGPEAREGLTFLCGVTGSAILYVNLAGYQVKAVENRLASRASGLFITSLYAPAAFSGYIIGAIAGRTGWAAAGNIQMGLLSLVGAALALAMRPTK